MVLPDTIRWHHPTKEIKFPFWLRLTIAIGCVCIAQFLAYRNLALNLARVIDEKQKFSMEINTLSDQLQREKQKNVILSEKVPKETSLKVRAIQAADGYERFFQHRAKHQPTCNQTSAMSPEEQRAVIEPCAKYNFQTMGEYAQRFAPDIMAMVEEFRAKGMNVKDIENCAPQGWCGIAISVQLRAFAARLDAKDNVKR